MSNLGWYQIITTAASKVGGVPQLIGIIFGSGILVGGGATVGICSFVDNNKTKRELKKKMKLKSINYSVHTSITNNNGFTINAGDQYKIIEIIGNSALIEIIGKDNNPYFLPQKVLHSISDF